MQQVKGPFSKQNYTAAGQSPVISDEVEKGVTSSHGLITPPQKKTQTPEDHRNTCWHIMRLLGNDSGNHNLLQAKQ